MPRAHANVIILEATHAAFPAALRDSVLIEPVRRLWAIGHLGLLRSRLLGLFCATRCPGNVILRTYDLARALRAAAVPVIGGFHTPMEKECLDVLLRGTQPVIVCPARGIQRLQIPGGWRQPLTENRLLILSPLAAQHRRPTAALAAQRNRFVATLADDIFVAHAPAGSNTERLCAEIVQQGKRVATFDLAANAHLLQRGVVGRALSEVVDSMTPGASSEVS